MVLSIDGLSQTQDLVAHWRFNNNALDGSGNNNHGTISGAMFTSNRFDSVGTALEFNGSSDYVEVQPHSTINNI